MNKYLLSVLLVSLAQTKSTLKAKNVAKENNGLDLHRVVKKSEVQPEYLQETSRKLGVGAGAGDTMKFMASMMEHLGQPIEGQRTSFGERLMKKKAGRTPRSLTARKPQHDRSSLFQKQENNPMTDLKYRNSRPSARWPKVAEKIPLSLSVVGKSPLSPATVDNTPLSPAIVDNTPLSLAEMISELRRYRRVKVAQHNMRRRMGAALNKMVVIPHSLVRGQVIQPASRTVSADQFLIQQAGEDVRVAEPASTPVKGHQLAQQSADHVRLVQPASTPVRGHQLAQQSADHVRLVQPASPPVRGHQLSQQSADHVRLVENEQLADQQILRRIN